MKARMYRWFCCCHHGVAPPLLSLEELTKTIDSLMPQITTEGDTTQTEKFNIKMDDGKFVDIQMLKVSNDRDEEFQNKVSLISRLRHDNLVELRGYCVVGNYQVLAYESAAMGSLHQKLHGEGNHTLSWKQRVRIAVDIGRGLKYLYKNGQPSITVENLNLTSRNVLLFKDFKAKIVYFNLSDQTRDQHAVAAALDDLETKETPEAKKTIVCSFGVLLLELLSGRDPSFFLGNGDLETYAISTITSNGVDAYVDAKLNGEYPLAGAQKLADIAIFCVQTDPKCQPTLGLVVRELQSALKL